MKILNFAAFSPLWHELPVHKYPESYVNKKIFIFTVTFLLPRSFHIQIIKTNNFFQRLEALTDNHLMLKVKAGDLDKMGLLFERYHRPLFAFLYHSTGQAAHSEDLVQTVFYRMLKYRHTFTEVGEYRTWMYHLARNVLIDAAKKNQRMVYQADVTAMSEKMISEPAADIQLEKKQESENLHAALAKLSPEYREVLVLSRFQELSYQEIADILGTSEGNIKVRVHRAMKELKSIYLSDRAI